MTNKINNFYNSIEDSQTLSQSALVEYFVYYLTVEIKQDYATSKQIRDCFVQCDLVTPKNIGSRLSEGTKTKPIKYIKVKNGYKLQRHTSETISNKLGTRKIAKQTSISLRNLETYFPENDTKDFLRETINCFEVGANRGTVVMAWLLALDHLFAYILKYKLQEFNLALSKDKGVKLHSIIQRDDFSEIKESKFIELCRSSKVISNDVRKILDTSLGTRNSCAHPSGIKISKTKVVAFVEDLIENVVQKYNL